MSHASITERAHVIARKRAKLIAVATVGFLLIEIYTRPVLRHDGLGREGPLAYAWVINVAILLLLLIPAGPLLASRRIQGLVNDEIARAHAMRGTATGFWVATILGLVLYLLPVSARLSAQDACFLIVVPATSVALLSFAWREARALRDG